MTKKAYDIKMLDAKLRDNLNNEDLFYRWLQIVPDDAEDEDFEELGNDEYYYSRCHKLYNELMELDK